MMANKEVIGPCLICDEDATGKHYGVQPCCAGCKTFFRRAVIQRQDTKCRRPGSCEQEISVRKMCRACRYKKCLDIGMSKEALQPRRDLIGCRRFADNRKTSTNSNSDYQPGTEFDSSPGYGESRSEFLKLIQKLTVSDAAIRAKKFEIIRTKTEAKKLSKLSKNPNWIPEQFPVMLASDISAVTQVEMITMMEWAQTLPNFMSLPLADRITLLKRFAVHHLILEHGYYTASLNVDDVWFISNGSCMPRQVSSLPEESKRCVAEDRKWRQDKLYTEMTNRCIDEVVYPLRRLQLSPEELCALKIIMLFNCVKMTTSIYLVVVVICVSLTPSLGQNNCPKPQNETCDISVLSCCDKNMRRSLNFTSSICDGSGIFADPFCYRTAIESMYMNGGINGLFSVCNAYNLFKDCLDISMNSCMTRSYYLLNGYSNYIATRTEILYGQLQFSCGAGMQSFISNENCFPSVWNSSRAAIEQCRTNFDSDYDQGRCYASSNLLSCVQVPFKSCSDESAWWMCEYSRTTAHIFFPECRGSCLMNAAVAK